MKIPYEKEKHKRGTGRGLHRLLCLVLVFAILTGSFPANTLTVSADEPQQDDVVTEQDATQSQEEKGTEGETQKPEKEPESKPETVKPEKEKQEDKKNANGKAENEGNSKAKLKEKAKEKPKKEPKAAEPRETTDANSISGMLWLDVLEDKNSGVLPGDGIRQEGEQPLAAYEVSLYKAEDKTTAVETVQTDSEGKYIFEHLEPGSYVVGISTCIKGNTEYLLPVAGITEDNQFADFNEDYTTVYSEDISLEEDTVVADINAGLRTPPGIVAASVGIQPSKSNLYVRNETKIGFGGKVWWVIGDSSGGTPASLRSPSAGTVTMFSDRNTGNTFGTSIFNPYTGVAGNNNYNGSTLQSAMTSAYNVLTPKERTYVVPRGSMDLQSYPNAGYYGYENPTNQNFWPLSAYEYNDMGSGAVVNTIRGDATAVWLRSPRSSNGGDLGVLGLPAGSGIYFPSPYYVKLSYPVRPAFYFDLSSALFSSVAATGGASDMKSASPGTKNLVKAVTPGANEAVKLTMEDDKSKTYSGNSVGGTQSGRLGMTVDPSLTDITSHPDGDVSFSYSGAQTGTGRSVSVMICRNNANPDILFYGRPVNCQSGNASGTATFTLPSKSDLPIGDYTLKIFNEEVNGAYYTDYASTPITVDLHVREVKVSATANPDDSKVYYTDTTPGHVDLTATVKNELSITGTTIQNVQWFRVPISNTTDYSAGNAFDTAYASSTVSANNKGTIGASSNDHITATFPLQVDKNATYWFQGTVRDPATNLTYTNVSSITVDNLYKEITCTVSGINNGVSPADTLYVDETIPGQYGIPYDLDGTTPLSAPSQGFDAITLSAKNEYVKYAPAQTISGQSLVTVSDTVSVDLDGTINAECDGDYTRYIIFYTLQRYLVDRDDTDAAIGTYDVLEDAANACLENVDCTITAIADDPAMGNRVLVSENKRITLTSDNPSTIRTITQQLVGGLEAFHLEIYGSLTLKDIILSGIGLTSANYTVKRNGGRESSSVTMENGAKITGCYVANGSVVQIENPCTFIMNGGEISNNRTDNALGSMVGVWTHASFTMNGGKISDNIFYCNNAGSDAGGVGVGLYSTTFTMNGGEISGNAGGMHTGNILGAGVYSSGSTFIMNGGKISDNNAGEGDDLANRSFGGGVYLSHGSTFIMRGSDSKILDNTAGGVFGKGGGAYVASGCSFTMYDGEISGNVAKRYGPGDSTGYGGGVYVDTGAEFSMLGGRISDNTASSDGGGVYTPDYSYGNPADVSKYSNISISNSAEVSENTALDGFFAPPVNYSDFDVRAANSFDGMLLDNNNINYRNPYYSIAYDANNGGDGTQRYYQSTGVSSGTTTVQAVNIGSGTDEANFTAPAGMSFAGWTENADGTGASYRPGDAITLSGNKILYAKWMPFVDVTISKTVAGDYGDRNKKFDFTITVQDTSGTPLASGTSLSYTGGTLPGSGAEALEDGTLTLDATGSADFKLKHGQTVTVSGIPTNGKVQIAETAVSGYSTTYQIDSGTAQNGTDTNLIAMNGTNRTAAFVNTHGEVVAAGITGGMTSTTLRITTAVLSLAGAWYLISRRARRKRQKES